ncbi:WRKY DNA-binding transcription factor 70-like [Gastrolobium bilobum]|uniref:WRKY DNA-binding transcription factor 70-like n=1 Tax=Gastrolobium bilobum TaxID=150636 RepID=UPI002AB12BD8|nr:WRKY DNA-binding transcription factor 70-like [Gastrolobium bilobum]
MENQSTNGKKAIEEELIRGRDMANELVEVLANEAEWSKLVLPVAEDLVRNVMRSFTNTLLLLNTNHGDFNEVAAPITIGDFSFSTANFQKLKDMDETCNSIKTPNTKSRRGCYKRKSIAPTWEEDTSILIEDGHGWRKYGQKMTMNAKYLRSYYRCTHKYDEGCEAIKHVQRIQEDPPLYRTTYYGYHTCKSPLNPEIILEPLSSSVSSTLLSFNNNLPSKQEQPFSSPFFASKKQKPTEVVHYDHIAQNQLSSSEDLLLCDYEIYFDYSRHVTMLSSTESVEFDNFYEQFGF